MLLLQNLYHLAVKNFIVGLDAEVVSSHMFMQPSLGLDVADCIELIADKALLMSVPKAGNDWLAIFMSCCVI